MTDTTLAQTRPEPPTETSIPHSADVSAQPPQPWWAFTAAVIGRVWLALVTGMLLIATLPAVVLPGWDAHVVVSGSMEPRINVGDVVISQQRSDYRPGQVIVFDDADRGAMTHRLQSIEGDTLTTKGDANPTADSSPVPRADVIGLGRVLVMFAGLPWVWFHTGQWTPLLAFLLSLLLAAAAVAADRPELGSTESRSRADAADSPNGDEGDRDADGIGEADEGADVAPSSTSPQPEPEPEPEPVNHKRRRAAALLPPAAALLLLLPLTINVLRPASAAFSATTTNASNTWTAAVATPATYSATVLADNPYIYLRLDESRPANTNTTLPAANLGSSALDQAYTRASSGNFNQSIRLESAASSNITPTPNTSAWFRQDGACILPPSGQPTLTNPPSVTVEAWIRSTGTEGGKILGFENGVSNTAVSSQYDRHLYQDGDGYVRFGVWTGTTSTVRSATPLNDNAWHHLMGTLDGPNGAQRLYVDGVLADSRTNITAENFTGRWRIGCGNLSGWTGSTAWSGAVPADLSINHTFIGYIDEPAIYLSALTAADAAERWALGAP